jgi:hypothetical protein
LQTLYTRKASPEYSSRRPGRSCSKIRTEAIVPQVARLPQERSRLLERSLEDPQSPLQLAEARKSIPYRSIELVPGALGLDVCFIQRGIAGGTVHVTCNLGQAPRLGIG